jgi:hypothetical protein
LKNGTPHLRIAVSQTIDTFNIVGNVLKEVFFVMVPV